MSGEHVAVLGMDGFNGRELKEGEAQGPAPFLVQVTKRRCDQSNEGIGDLFHNAKLEESMQPTAVSAAAMLHEKITARTARVGVVGLGYVGLPLAVEFAGAGFQVTGIDVMESKVSTLNRGGILHSGRADGRAETACRIRQVAATTDFSVVRDLDTINICVPTPLRKTKDPDMSYIVAACEEIAKYFHPGLLVILESTTYPGTTDELVLPMLEKSRAEGGRGFLPVFFAGARRSRQSQVPDQEHSQSRRRNHARRARSWALCFTRRRSKRWCR